MTLTPYQHMQIGLILIMLIGTIAIFIAIRKQMWLSMADQVSALATRLALWRSRNDPARHAIIIEGRNYREIMVGMLGRAVRLRVYRRQLSKANDQGEMERAEIRIVAADSDRSTALKRAIDYMKSLDDARTDALSAYLVDSIFDGNAQKSEVRAFLDDERAIAKVTPYLMYGHFSRLQERFAPDEMAPAFVANEQGGK